MFETYKLGADLLQGKVFTYKMRVENIKPYIIPMMKAANGTMVRNTSVPIYDGGLGMTLAILRVPACLTINFNYLEALKRNKIVDFYEVRNFNSEIVFYWRQMMPSEVKTVSVDLT